MKKVILEEIENMKYLLGYKRGVVISEQQTPQLGTIQPSNQSTADMFKNAQASAAGLTNTNNQPQTPSPAAATGTPAASTTTSAPAASTTTSGPAASTTTSAPAAATPATPIKIGVKYPSIEELQNSLNTKNQAGLTPDGKYGPKTAASVLAALQKAPTTPTNTTPVNTVVGGDPNSEVAKKTAEANASTGVAANTTPSTSAQNTQPATGGANFTDVDNSEFS